MFIWFYRLIFAPLAILLSPKYLLKMKRRGGYQEKFGTRFARGVEPWPKTEGRRRIWIQAVSLGELLVVESLARRLAEDPRNEILLTTTTSTGYALAKEKFESFCARVQYFPLDFWLLSRSVWNKVNPDLAICVETELWPEHIHQSVKRGVPMVLINGRLSDRSFKYSKRLAFLFRGLIAKVSKVLAVSEADAERFRAIGVPAERLSVTGNLKVDVSLGSILGDEERIVLKEQLGLEKSFVLLGSSTWPGEEAMMLKALRRVRETGSPDAKLIVVPRHPERRDEIRKLLESEASDLRIHFKSTGEPQGELDILIGDTTGELRVLTQLSDLAFIGKSLPPHKEGQTPIECGLLGVPMVFGSGMANFRSIRAGLVETGSAIQVSDEGAAIEKLVELAEDEKARETMSEKQQLWAANSRGALEKTITVLEELED